ncbi:MAG: carbohydrate ABC transporter permease [Eubacteriales bacterium]|nr:carbohydrate ABC transporter permease [Eubacteriales bacterium]
MPKRKVTRIIMICVIGIICLIALFPFYMMIMMGSYKTTELYKGLKLLPGNYLLENIKSLTQIRFPLYYFNSLLVAGSVSILTVLVCAMTGYGISKYNFKGKEILTAIIMMTMMIPTQLSLVGFAKEMVLLRWNNTLLPLMIPPVANAFGVFWMINYTKAAIPDAVIESAKLDGCGELGVFFRIALPFMKPACVTLALIAFLTSWNSFLIPLIVISKEALYTLPLGIKQLANQFRTDIGGQILALTVATIPILFFFGYFSDNLIAGLASAAVKE